MTDRDKKVLKQAFLRANQRARELMLEKSVDKETMKWLTLKELIKEQIPNENTSNTAG